MLVTIDPASVLDAKNTHQALERQMRLTFTRYLPLLHRVSLSARKVPCADRQLTFQVTIAAGLHNAVGFSVKEISRSLDTAIHRAMRRVDRQLKQRVEGNLSQPGMR